MPVFFFNFFVNSETFSSYMFPVSLFLPLASLCALMSWTVLSWRLKRTLWTIATVVSSKCQIHPWTQGDPRNPLWFTSLHCILGTFFQIINEYILGITLFIFPRVPGSFSYLKAVVSYLGFGFMLSNAKRLSLFHY